jgi:hypothetical protein
MDMLLGGWAPGAPPNAYPKGVARKIPAGADIVFQVHYHNQTGQAQTDRSGMAIHFAREPIIAEGRITLVGTMRVDIKAGDANSIHTGVWRAPYDMKLYSVMPHMHFLGKSMKVTATFPDGAVRTIIDAPRFDFNWQIAYAFVQPLLLPKGTSLQMVSVHDNSAENPYNPTNPPKDVRWGEATDEEMAHCWMNVTRADENLGIIPNPPVLDGAKVGGAGQEGGAAGGN